MKQKNVARREFSIVRPHRSSIDSNNLEENNEGSREIH